MNCSAGSFADPPNGGVLDELNGGMLLSDFAIQVRRRAGSAISVISYECADLIISSGLLPTLCSNAQGILGGGVIVIIIITPLNFFDYFYLIELLSDGQLTQSQSCNLLEALVSVSEKVIKYPSHDYCDY